MRDIDYREKVLADLLALDCIHLHVMGRGPAWNPSKYLKYQFMKSSICETDRCIKIEV